MSEQSQQSRLYQAIGVVEGVLDLSTESPTLTVAQTSFPASVSKQVRRKHQPGQVERFRVYPGRTKGQLSFRVLARTNLPATTFTLKGCWELHQDAAMLVIYRNSIYFQGDRRLRNLVPVDWGNAPPTDGQYWELDAALEGDRLVVIQADGPFEPPPKATKYQPPQKTQATQANHQPAAEPAPKSQPQTIVKPLTPQEIQAMATPVKTQLTCKLNQVPAHRELPDKRIEFYLKDESERIFTVRMKAKMFKKLTDHGYQQWVAAITGELGSATETGFELLNPALQVFEKKASPDAAAKQQKAAPTEAKPPSEKTVMAKPQKGEAQTQAIAGKRKSLLDGVRLK